MKYIKNLKLKALPLTIFLLASTTSWAEEAGQPWLIRVRATQLNWNNQQNNGLSSVNVAATNVTIPEFDVTYFINQNMAFELSLTYPQKVDVNVSGVAAGNMYALPPSLIAQYHFTDLGAFKPYLGLGGNFTQFTRSNILNGAASVNSSSTGAVAQIGFDYMLDKNWGVNIDVKYLKIKTDVYVSGADKGQLGLNPNSYSIGVTYCY